MDYLFKYRILFPDIQMIQFVKKIMIFIKNCETFIFYVNSILLQILYIKEQKMCIINRDSTKCILLLLQNQFTHKNGLK